MKIKNEPDGSVTVERTIVNGHQNAQVALHLIEHDIPYTIESNTLTVNKVADRKFFQIGFQPGSPSCEVIDGGSGNMYCQSGCNSPILTCAWTAEMKDVSGGAVLIVTYCTGTCTDCKAVSDGCGGGGTGTGTQFTNGGSIFIDAEFVNFVE